MGEQQIVERAKGFAFKAAYRTWRGVAPQEATPYATHLPILAGLARLVRPQRVLELGSGPFSTPLFLDRQTFPDLEELVSVEDDEKWAEVVRGAVGDDPRLNYIVLDRVPSYIRGDLDDFDLIFIDDSTRIPDRAETLLRVGEQRPPGVVVMHDFEWRPYRRVAHRQFHMVMPLTTLTPQVGVMWNMRRLDPRVVASLKGVVAAGRADGLQVTDLESWRPRLDAWAAHAVR